MDTLILKVVYHVKAGMVEEFREKLTEANIEMRFRIATTQSDIDFEREKSAREDTKEGIPIRQFSDAYLETLAVYRKQIKVVAQFINATKD